MHFSLFLFFLLPLPNRRGRGPVKTDRTERSRAVKVIDKETDGSKTVITRGKEFSKRAAKDPRDEDGLREVFLHLAAMLH